VAVLRRLKRKEYLGSTVESVLVYVIDYRPHGFNALYDIRVQPSNHPERWHEEYN
jgi:hypothetical protein